VREHADKNKVTFPTAAPLIDGNMFMDDFAAGAENDDNVITIYYELTALMKLISFPLAKWASNSDQLKAIWKAEGQDTEVRTQVLGVNWNTETDCFLFDPEVISKKLPEGPITKRRLLQITARFYDPLRLYSPVSVVGKLLFQDTWCRGIDWNELPPDLWARWRAWVSTLSSLSRVYVPRWLATSRGNYQVHVFCDASERAYGEALYIRSIREHKTLVRLACSKNRLAPVKRVTLPRLELLADWWEPDCCATSARRRATVIIRQYCGRRPPRPWVGYAVILTDGKPLFATGLRRYKRTQTPRSGGTARGQITPLTISHEDSWPTN
jgi:hypothetical protein